MEKTSGILFVFAFAALLCMVQTLPGKAATTAVEGLRQKRSWDNIPQSGKGCNRFR
ncbi:MAG: hypothetical protein IKK08_01505 [Clostridia bacterium]|nr:hypothetical protein [Clostridia bacterium]